MFESSAALIAEGLHVREIVPTLLPKAALRTARGLGARGMVIPAATSERCHFRTWCTATAWQSRRVETILFYEDSATESRTYNAARSVRPSVGPGRRGGQCHWCRSVACCSCSLVCTGTRHCCHSPAGPVTMRNSNNQWTVLFNALRCLCAFGGRSCQSSSCCPPCLARCYCAFMPLECTAGCFHEVRPDDSRPHSPSLFGINFTPTIKKNTS